MANALVTGGAGFIGSHLVGRLCADGHAVRVLDSGVTGDPANLAPWADAIEYVEGDIRDEAAVLAALRDRDWVFHLAAQVSVPESVEQPRYAIDVNVRGTATVAYAAAAAGVQRFVFVSSCAVYGDTGAEAVTEDAPTQPLSPYGASKRMAECLLGELHRSGRLPTLSLRFFNVYGPRQRADSQYSGVVARFLDHARQGKGLTVYGDGGQTRDFVYVTDGADLMVRAAEQDPAGWPDVVNVGTGSPSSIGELAHLVATCVPGLPPVVHAPERRGDLRHSAADITRLRDRLHWSASIPLADGVRALWEDFAGAA